MLDYADESLIVRLSIVIGIGALALTLLFLLLAISFRGVLSRRERRHGNLEDVWMPLMLGALREPRVDVPTIARRDRARVLALWNRLVAGIEGEAVDRLRTFAHQAGLDGVALRVIGRGAPGARLVAAVFLGRLQDVRGVRPLLELTRAPQLVVRAEAARALVRIDPEAGPATVAPMVVQWDDCHAAVAVAVLKDARPHVVADAIGAEAMRATDERHQARMLEVLESFQGPVGLAAVRSLLPTATDPEVTARCLAVLAAHRRPEDAALVRPLLHHPVAFVKVRAVAALGRMMAPGDDWLIAGCLSDGDWWVRRRAAEALVASRRVPRARVELLASVHPDRYARGALSHALSEAEART